MMDDLISRQDAIDAMTNTLWHYPNECYRNFNEYEFVKGLVEFGLKNVPSVEPEITLESAIDYLRSIGWMQEHDRALSSVELEQRWIPVTERLPEPYKDVLVYYEYFKYDAYSTMCQTHGIGFCSTEGTWHGDVSGLNVSCLAWMPLPDPYEEDKQ